MTMRLIKHDLALWSRLQREQAVINGHKVSIEPYSTIDGSYIALFFRDHILVTTRLWRPSNAQ